MKKLRLTAEEKHEKKSWNEFIRRTIKNGALITCLLIALIGCKKSDWVERPTCQRVYMFMDSYNSDTTLTGSVEMHPFKPYQNYLCNSELLKWRNIKPQLLGCARDGYFMYRYSVGNEVSKPVIFNH